MTTIVRLFIVVVLLGTLVHAADPAGTYTNGADGFDLRTFYVLKDGRGFIGAPVKWRYDVEKKTIVVRGNLGPNLAVEERTLRFDADKNMVYLPSTLALTHGQLEFVTKDVHEGIRKYLDTFDWDFEKHVIGKK